MYEKWKIKWSYIAEDDITSIRDYLVAHRGVDVASYVLSEMFTTVERLKIFPRLGSNMSSRLGVETNLRSVFAFKTYSIIYDIDEDDRAVEILRIWHNKRNPRNLKKSMKNHKDK